MHFNTEHPHYSLVVLTYERPEPLRLCLESLAAQDFDKSKFEVIVIDDGSKASNAPIVDSFKDKISISYCYHGHRGVSATRNAGIKQARGNFIGFIPDDNTLPSNYLSTADRFFKTHPDAKVITFNVMSSGYGLTPIIHQFYFELALWDKLKDADPTSEIIQSNAIPASRGAIFNREVFEKCGMFNEKLTGGEDSDMATRLTQNNILLYCFPRFYLKHWENKSFLGFLEQRYRYGNYFVFNNPMPSSLLNIYLYRFPKSVFNAYRRQYQTAKRIDRRMTFICLTPFLLLFLFTFFLGYYASYRRATHPQLKNN